MKGRKPQKGAVRRGVKDAYTPAKPPAAKGHGGAMTQLQAYHDTPKELRVGVRMPEDIAADPLKAEIWATVAPAVNGFADSDLPTLRLLVHWHAVAEMAVAEMEAGTGLDPFTRVGGVARKSDTVTVLKQASAEIRALSDMLGLSPLARTRIGLMDAAKVKTAAETAAMFQSIDAAYGILPAEAEVRDVED